jgi:hypothetical protein
MKACQLKNDIYEPKKLEAVYQNIVAKSKTDKPQYYEIRVDDFAVVEKTNDPERFMNYAEFVDANTKHISVFLYHHNCTSSDKWFFHLQPNQFTNINGLNGLGSMESPLEQEKQQKEKWRKDLHYEQLIEENADLKKEIEELEHTIELIEEEKTNIKSNRDIGFSSIAGFIIDGASKSKFVKENLPFINDLAGVVTNETPESENSFKRKQSSKAEPQDVETEEVETVEITDEDKQHIGFMREIKARVGSIELANVIHLLEMVTRNPQSIHFAVKQVSNYLKQKPTPNNPSQPIVNPINDEDDL